MANEYEDNARFLAADYETLDPATILGWLLPLLPGGRALRVLDVGAGSGRDAAWWTAQGHSVTAVEPAAAMLEQARLLHADADITWLADGLPGLAGVEGNHDLVCLVAVWMFVPPPRRAAAFARLVELLAPDGLLAFMVRDPIDPARAMHPTAADEIPEFAAMHGLRVEHCRIAGDFRGRSELSWHCHALRLPDLN